MPAKHHLSCVLGNHKKSFNVEKYKKDTKFSEEYWRIKELNGTPSIKWTIIGKCLPYNQNTKSTTSA